MKNVLIVSGHPNLEGDSVANKAMVEAFARLEGYTVDRLDLLYPDYKIDVAAEQAKLVDADVIVLQYPVFWYGMPALLQKWMEDVFAHGFSHGSQGKALVGKKLVLSMTIGAPEEAYGEGAAVHVEDLLVPAKGACALTGMEFSGCEYTFGVSYASRVDDAARKAIADAGRNQAARVAKLIEEL
ncbi:NAD(P)H-dependent oxidoreductase [Slackia heliotrinireducens]|uniref:NAD(P)H-dependent oxidoreductase n=1 Tax=Slackia heliotrinireducens TaxID=84110 RepID=UPI003315EE94